jgi:hypothetical protein
MQEAKLGKLESISERIDKVINGNGNEGLLKTVIRLEEAVKEHTEIVKDVRTVVSGLVKFETVIETTIAKEERGRVNKRWLIGTIVVLVLGVAGLIIEIIS